MYRGVGWWCLTPLVFSLDATAAAPPVVSKTPMRGLTPVPFMNVVNTCLNDYICYQHQFFTQNKKAGLPKVDSLLANSNTPIQKVFLKEGKGVQRSNLFLQASLWNYTPFFPTRLSLFCLSYILLIQGDNQPLELDTLS